MPRSDGQRRDGSGDEEARPLRAPPNRSSSSRATTRSSNGATSSPDRLRRLVALAGDHDDVAGSAPLEGDGDRRRRSGSTTSRRRRRAARRSAAMIAAGSSLRGLSDVRTTTLRASGCRLAHRRPLGAVAVAAAAEHHQRRVSATASSRAASQHLLEPVGRVGVVDDDAERLALVDRLEPAGHRPASPMPVRDRVGSGCRARRAAWPRPGRSTTLNRPPSGTRSSTPRQVNALPDGRSVEVGDIGERVRDGRDLGGIEQQPAVGIVDVDDRTQRRSRRRTARLGLEVALHGPVEVEVVAAEVGEHGDREVECRRPGAARARATTPPSRPRSSLVAPIARAAAAARALRASSARR